MSFHPKQIPYSVVIPTLGGPSLAKTIQHLNRGTAVPGEILVCIPEAESPRAKGLQADNVRVVVTSCRGQVSQRAFGFQQAKHELVLQLDDDIYVRETCVQDLINCIMTAGEAAVGPRLYDSKIGEYYSFLNPSKEKKSWFEKLLYWVINGSRGYQPGRISKAGVGMGVPEEFGDWCSVEWLPGGCVLHWKRNLILSNYYPFNGKAFAEDLFHSILLSRKGVQLIRCSAASCDVDFSSPDKLNLVSTLKGYLAFTRTMTVLVKDIGGSLPRLYLYLVLNLVRLVTRKLATQAKA